MRRVRSPNPRQARLQRIAASFAIAIDTPAYSARDAPSHAADARSICPGSRPLPADTSQCPRQSRSAASRASCFRASRRLDAPMPYVET